MAKPLRNATKQYGASGTTIYSGIITGEEYNRRLVGQRALEMYDIMLRSDADIHSMLELCKQPIIAADWKVQPAKGPDGKVTPKDQEIADLVTYEFFHNNIDFDDLLYQALDMLDFGFSVFEKVFETHPYLGKETWGFKDIQFRKQTTIRKWTMADGQPGVHQQTSIDSYDIPWDKLIVFTNKKRGDNYEGISLLRYVFKDWDMKDKLTLVNAIALEKMAIGVPVIGEDPESNTAASTKDMEAAETAMEEFRANEKGYIKRPKSVVIEMLDMKSSTTKDVLPTLAMHKRAIYASIMATFMDLGGSSGSGAQSLSKDLTAFFMNSEEYIAKTFRKALNNQAVKQLVDLNYSDLPNGYPEIMNGSIADDDIAAAATAMSSLAGAGLLTPDAEMEDATRTRLGLPAMPDDLKNSYEDRRQAAEDAKNKLTVAPDGTKPADTKKPADKTKAAIDASKEAQRRMIEVIFADED